MASSKSIIILFLVNILCFCSSPLMVVRCDDHDAKKIMNLIHQPPVNVDDFVTSVNSAIHNVGKVTSFVSKLITTTNVSRDFRASINDVVVLSHCLDLLHLSAEELVWTLEASLNPYGSISVGTGDLSSDLRTWLSSVLVNQDSCIEALIDDDNNVNGANKNGSIYIKTLLEKRLNKIASSVTTSLAMVRPISIISNDDEQAQPPSSWPEPENLTPAAAKESADLVVALDGSGDFTSINEAVNAAPDRSPEPFVIYVKGGVYRENVMIDQNKWNIVMLGDGMDATIITGCRSAADGFKTYNSATFCVKGLGFIGQDMTFENTAGPEKQQAVAFLSDSDLSVLHRCGVMGYQDALYAHKNRQFYKLCVIVGTVDFIFGRAAAVFQDCQIVARKGLPDQMNTITAQGRKSPNEASGFSIQSSNITALPEVTATWTPMYLGRPWQRYSTTVIMQSDIGGAISPPGWLEWDGNFSLNTLYYGEYMNRGAGADLDKRVTWPGFHVITDAAVADGFTVAKLITGDSWLPSTGIEYRGGLN